MIALWQFLVIAGALFFGFCLALFVLFKQPRSGLHRTFFLLVFGSVMWGFGILGIFSTHSFFFNQFVFYGAGFMLAGMLFFARAFPFNDPFPRDFYAYLLPPLLVGIAGKYGLIVEGLSVTASGFAEPVNGPFAPLFAFTSAAYLSATMYIFFKNYQRSYGRYRAQMRYVVVGVLLHIAAVVIFNVFLPAVGIYSLNLVGPLFFLPFVGLVATAIVRHELLDIRVVVQRGAIYSALLGLVVATYLGLVFLLGRLFEVDERVSAVVSAGITTVLGVFGVSPVERYFRRLTDSVFFKDRYDYSLALEDLSKVANRNLDLSDLISQGRACLKAIFRASSVAIVLAEENDYQTGALVVPIIHEDRSVARIIMGDKLSGDPYTAEDIQLLSTFSHHAAVAIEKARLYGQVKQYSSELEHKVAQRTQELTRLYESQSQFLVDISHQLQTPLAILKGHISLFRTTMLRGGHEETTLRATDTTLNRMSRLIQNLLTLGQYDFGVAALSPELFRLDLLIEELCDDVRVLALDKQINFCQEVSVPVWVCADRKRLKDVFLNLASNALKYTNARGSITIRVDSHPPHARVLIIDTGRGIANEDLPHIFERFYRSRSKKTPTEGVGLGLAIASQITLMHGGFLSAESQLGKGSTFILSIPLATPLENSY